MRQTWTCTFSKCTHKNETTSHLVPAMWHFHNSQEYALYPFKKEKKKSNPNSVKKLKADLWDLFSEYVRRSNINEYGLVSCVTCKCEKDWKSMQAGHFVSRSHNTVFVDPHNVHPQCYHCNMTLKGNMIAYHAFMLETYGQEEIDRLQRLAKVNHQFKPYELENLIKQTKEKLKEITSG